MIAAAEIFRLTTANRLLVASVLDDLDETSWRTATLCQGWSVREMAAHLVQPMLVGFGRFFAVSVRFRGDTERTVDYFTRRLARRPARQLVELLRGHAADRVDPPRVGPMGPFAETCVHLRDIARPLGLAADVPVEHWRILMDYLTSPGAAPGLVKPGTVEGLRLVATDTDWASGDGVPLSGPIEALALAVTGRGAALPDLDGPGVSLLGRRLRAGR